MNFDEWLEAYYSGTQIDDVIAGMMRTAFEAGRCGAGTVGLRDKFAMAALQGLISSVDREFSFENFAEYAYKHADAMLKERVK